jgi:hypothetical protein
MPEALSDTRGGKPAADARDIPKAKRNGRLNPRARRVSRFRRFRAPSNDGKAISTDSGAPGIGLGLAVAQPHLATAPFRGRISKCPLLRTTRMAFAYFPASTRKTIGHQLSEAGGSELNRRLVRGLAEAHDSGERDPDALKRSAPRELFVTHAAS